MAMLTVNNTSQDQPLTPTAITPATNVPSPTQIRRKPNRRANTAERRATHNAVERQRRETLNGRFLDLASLLPNLSQIRRPSKSSIVNSSIAYVHASRRHHLLASRELRALKSENDHLRFEINEWRDRAGLMRIEEPVRGEAFAIVISGQMEVIQATLKPGSGAARGKRARGDGDDGDDDDDDADEGEGEGEGEDGMIGLGGYGGSYMDDIEEDVILEGPPTSSPLQLVGGGFSNPPSSMPPPSTNRVHLHHVQQQQQQQQQQMALNAAIHHSHQGPPLENMDPRIANLNGNGFSPTSNYGFQQQQQPYNTLQQQQQEYQQQTFSSPYPPDKLWNDDRSQAQYHMQVFTPAEPLHQQQQYDQPSLSVNTGVGMGVNNEGIRRMAMKTKVAYGNGIISPSSHSNSPHDSPLSVSASGNSGSPIPIPSPASSLSSSSSSSLSHSLSRRPISHSQVQMRRSGSPHHQQYRHDIGRSSSRSGSESGSAAASPSYELHSTTQGDYANANNVGGGGVPRGNGIDHHVGFMGAGMGLAPGRNNTMSGGGGGGGMNGGMNMSAMAYGGPGHANSNAMMIMMM